ncbi:diguanylate cyclase [Bacillus sp. S13(2024)]|uniref:diguanylate cyclase n=1 Tax=unclassified Bacillus (in: firmicutes) TaxID=185979 RepID=UPI003D20189A
MLNDLFINTTIILSFIFVGAQLFKNISLKEPLSFEVKCFVGIVMGALGALLMKFGVHIEDVMLDLRYLSVILAAVIGGPIASLLASIIILIVRLLLTGYSIGAQIGVYVILLTGIGCTIISMFRISVFKKWIWLHVYCLTVSSIGIYIVFKDVLVLGLYLVVSIMTGYMTFLSAHYALQSNELFRKMKQYATMDPLTGLGNVRKFDTELNRNIEDKKKNNNPLCLLLVDIDYFKDVNDKYGHPAGDEVLQQLGAILKNSSPFPHLVFRKGGEEFALLLPKSTLQYAVDIGERIRAAVEKHVFRLPNDICLHITISVGASIYVDSPQQFIQLADDALYSSKRNGRNQVNAVS